MPSRGTYEQKPALPTPRPSPRTTGSYQYNDASLCGARSVFGSASLDLHVEGGWAARVKTRGPEHHAPAEAGTDLTGIGFDELQHALASSLLDVHTSRLLRRCNCSPLFWRTQHQAWHQPLDHNQGRCIQVLGGVAYCAIPLNKTTVSVLFYALTASSSLIPPQTTAMRSRSIPSAFNKSRHHDTGTRSLLVSILTRSDFSLQ